MSRYQPISSSNRRAVPKDLPLPKGFTSVTDILDDSIHHNRTVSVVGVVKDYMLPRSTAGKDWKSRITLFDQTTEEWSEGINLDVFLPLDEMPKVEAGDIVIASMVTRQRYKGSLSILTNKTMTDLHVYDVRHIMECRGSRSARGALKPPSRRVRREPDQKEHEYVLWLYNKIDKTVVPDREEVASRAEQTLNIKDKFSLLQDVKEGRFSDIIVQVVKAPYDLGDRTSLWVSDYTENNNFFNKTEKDSDWVDGIPIRDGDEYGYTSKWSKSKSSTTREDKWDGPYGKRSIQLTCWEPHADFIRRNVDVGSWVYLRNVQIGNGKLDTNVEGFLRTDKAYPDRIYVSVLDPQEDRETLDPRLLEAIRRKRDYVKDHKQALNGGTKRKSEGSVQNENRKSRRKMKREGKAKAYQEQQESKQAALLGLNDHIKCEHADKTIVPFSSILEPVRYDTTFELPFTCANYRTQARVVDFHPANLHDFATSRANGEFDVLSDNDDGGGDSDSSTSSKEDNKRRPSDKLIWEWCFALKLEEVSPTLPKGQKPASAWVLVDNTDAQLLTDLDAHDLRSKNNADLLEKLRQQMFILWGDLEERKSAIEARKSKNGWTKAPALLSDDEENGAGTGHVPGLSQTSNKPFACCIRQYGVKITSD
ncbi:Protection of telomeres protein 1 [Cytospora mali]|uniref:Protection of telomeres protein 1 n=1 Tax=Cytospora mali TaxID=578113 RepID=A0A194UYS6_CYTMA|nr:Protection of telomeres protein 1 [Valsa mali var. pyri (nom. inval.)]